MTHFSPAVCGSSSGGPRRSTGSPSPSWSSTSSGRVARCLGAAFPLSTLLGFLGFAAIVYFVVRLVPWVRTRVLWSLRNRLIVAYLFMAVVPVVLLVTMIGIATYLFYLQLGAHLLNDAVQQSRQIIDTDAEPLPAAIERQARQLEGSRQPRHAHPTRLSRA